MSQRSADDATLRDGFLVDRKSLEYAEKDELLEIIRDITERKRTEEILKFSEVEKSLILDSTIDVVLYLNTDMKILWGNRKALDTVGMRPEELAGRHCWEIWHQRTEACDGCPVILARDTGEPQEGQVRTPDGKEWYLRGFPVKDVEGKVKGIVEFCLDVTERNRAESALRESEDKFARAFRATPSVLVISTMEEGTYIEVNESFERALGYSREEAIGRTSLELNIWETPEARARFIQKHQEEGAVRGFEANFRRKSGEILVGLLSSEIIEIKGEKRLLILVSDITERKRMEQEIEALNTGLASYAAELEAVNRDLEAFNYAVSHDLRSPLTAISGYSQVLLTLGGDRLGEQCRDFVREICRAAEDMNELITSMLEFSRLSRSAITRETVDLTGLAKTVAAQLKMREPQRNAVFTIAEGIPAEGDAKLLKVVLENLIGNAWKYTGRQETAAIEFGIRETGGSPVYFVRDNGPGFDMAHADRLFTPFQRLPGAAGFAGHGIGLATVKRIIECHSGRIWAEGEPGKGASFYFTF